MTPEGAEVPVSEGRSFKPEWALVALVVVVGLMAGGYILFFESEEAKVRRALAVILDEAADRDPRGVSSMFTEDFQASYRRGRVDKNDAHQALIRLLMVDYKFGFEVTVEPEEVPVLLSADGASATSTFRLSARGKASKEGDWIPLRYREAKGKLPWKMTFQKTDDGWKLHRIDWVPEKK